MRKFFSLLLLAISLAVFSTVIDKVVLASDNLKTLSCEVKAENHLSRRTSVVDFLFYYERNNQKMRIEYISPKSMKGSYIAIDGKYFYNYIASMKRKIKKKLGGSTKNPGKDMGVLYNFVKGDLKDILKNFKVTYKGTEKIKIDSKTQEALYFVLEGKDENQHVWFNSTTLFPIKVEIYIKGKLKIRLVAKNVKINQNIDEKLFSPF